MKRRLFPCSIIFISAVVILFSCYSSLPEILYVVVYRVPIAAFINLDGIMFRVTEEEKADMYITLITDTFDGDKNRETFPGFATLYIQKTNSLTKPIKNTIQEYFSLKSVGVKWINNRKEVPIEDCCAGAVVDGAIITLGEIYFPGETRAYSIINIYVNGLAAKEDVYYLEKINGKWQISGDPINIFIN